MELPHLEDVHFFFRFVLLLFFHLIVNKLIANQMQIIFYLIAQHLIKYSLNKFD